MKPPNLTKWSNLEETEGLLLFAQSLREMLFDYTLDSFKVPALNLHLNVIELNTLCAKYYKGGLKKGALEFSMNELQQRIEHDVVVGTNLKEKLKDYVDILKKNLDQKDKIITVTAAMLSDVGGVYWELLKNRLDNEVATRKDPAVLWDLAASFATELELRGFSREYVYSKLSKFFFRRNFSPGAINRSSLINDFISIFEGTDKKWTVVIRGRLLPKRFIKYSLRFGIRVKFIEPVKFSAFEKFVEYSHSSSSLPCYYILDTVSAKDPRKAHFSAQKIFDFFADVCRFHEHGIAFEFDKTGFVLSSDQSKQYIFPAPKKPMECGSVNKYAERDEYFLTTLDILNGKHFHSQTRFMFAKVMDFHHAAIESTSYENQLLDLWAAMEGFLPKPTDEANKIPQYVDMLMPVLLLNYNFRILRAFSDDLYRAGIGIRSHVFATPIEGSFFEKVVALVVLEDLRCWWDYLLDYMDYNPLLRYRCNKIRGIFSAAKDIKKNLDRHETKLRFHLRRIYTMRNQIAHDAESLPYIRMLVENLHNYFDSLIVAVGAVGKESSVKISIGVALEVMGSSMRAALKELNSPKYAFTPRNYLRRVFGESNILNPYYSKIELPL